MTQKVAVDATVVQALARSSPEQDVLGPVDPGSKVGASTDVRMHTLDQAAVGGPDLVRRGALGQSQDG